MASLYAHRLVCDLICYVRGLMAGVLWRGQHRVAITFLGGAGVIFEACTYAKVFRNLLGLPCAKCLMA